MSNKAQVSAKEILAKYELDELDKQLLKLKVERPAMSDREIGIVLEIDRRVVKKRLAREAWRHAFDEFFLPAKTLIERDVSRLTRKYLKLADSHDEKVAERVIRAILISHGVLKNKVDFEAPGGEWLVIKRPMAKEVIEVGPKKLGKKNG